MSSQISLLLFYLYLCIILCNSCRIVTHAHFFVKFHIIIVLICTVQTQSCLYTTEEQLESICVSSTNLLQNFPIIFKCTESKG